MVQYRVIMDFPEKNYVRAYESGRGSDDDVESNDRQTDKN